MTKCNYYIIIQEGTVFEGNLDAFRKKFYEYPPVFNEEQIVNHIKDWAEVNGWKCEINYLN